MSERVEKGMQSQPTRALFLVPQCLRMCEGPWNSTWLMRSRKVFIICSKAREMERTYSNFFLLDFYRRSQALTQIQIWSHRPDSVPWTWYFNLIKWGKQSLPLLGAVAGYVIVLDTTIVLVRYRDSNWEWLTSLSRRKTEKFWGELERSFLVLFNIYMVNLMLRETLKWILIIPKTTSKFC